MSRITQDPPDVNKGFCAMSAGRIYQANGGPVIVDRDAIGEYARPATTGEMEGAAAWWLMRMGRPLPPMLMHWQERECSCYELPDGRQRICPACRSRQEAQ